MPLSDHIVMSPLKLNSKVYRKSLNAQFASSRNSSVIFFLSPFHLMIYNVLTFISYQSGNKLIS